MEKNIIDITETFVRELFSDKLSPELRFHDLDHTLSVREVALSLGRHYQVGQENLEALELATLLHDTGYVEVYSGHEDNSMKIAVEFLTKHGYPKEKIQQVNSLIAATKLVNKPQNIIEEIIKDADLSNMGQKKYFKTIENLRYEMKVFLGMEYKDLEWNKNNILFMDSHFYFTDRAKELFDEKKSKNRDKVVETIESLASLNGSVEHIEKKSKEERSINKNKSAQMMFKTALRNHIDLTSIADNKANIMLSINALIITISMPMLSTQLKENPGLIIPTSILLVTCVASIIYATLATRPIDTKGMTNLENIMKGTTNLFFYGNFYKMNFKDYKEGVRLVIDDDNKLDDTIMSDLFYLGKALGGKFAQLRTCYTVFMIGITVTVIAFAVTFLNMK